MKKYFLIIAAMFVLAVGCTSNSTTKETKEVDSVSATMESAQLNENKVVFTSEQANSIGIVLGGIEKKELTNTVKVNGMLTVPNRNKAFVTPVYNGVVRSLNVHPGDKISKGQVIATIANPELMQMQQQLQQINTQIKMAEVEVARQQQLVEGNAAPLKRLQQAQTELATLRSQRSGLQKQLGGIGASQGYSSLMAVRAPISGTISKVMTQLGSHVDMASPIAEIVNNDLMHLEVFVYEKDLGKLKTGQTIHFSLTNNPEVKYDAQVYSIGTAFEDDSKTVPVHANIKGNKSGLIDGMNVTAVISLNNQLADAVATDAIVSDKGQDYIFVVSNETAVRPPSGDSGIAKINNGAGNTGSGSSIIFEKVPVAKGTSHQGFTQITPLKALAPGAKIVIKNAFFVLAKMNHKEEPE